MKSPLGLWILALLLCWLPACAPQVDPHAVVLWTAFEGAEYDTLLSQVQQFRTRTGQDVVVLKVPFAAFQQKMLIAGPARQGPDLLIGPHDWIGQLCTVGLLAPVPPDIVDSASPSFYEIAKRAVSFEGQIYSAPLMMECVVLARNTELCPEQPRTLDQLVTQATSCAEKNPGVLGFAYEMRDFYFTGAFMTGFGADFLSAFSSSSGAELDLAKINFDTPQGVAGASWVAELARGNKYDLVPQDMKNNTAVELFLKGRLGMMLCGPWNMGAVRASGIPYALEPLPDGPAGPCSPFVGVTGVMLGSYSTEKTGVRELMAYLVSPEVTAQLCQSAARAPARVETASLLAENISDPVVRRDLELFSKVAQKGIPMPNHPAVGATFWSAMQGAFELIIKGEVTPSAELRSATERVRAKIRFMTE
jgi:arabinogalactan oligomer/maltooligosaccharide transport system substrate-binding protein